MYGLSSRSLDSVFGRVEILMKFCFLIIFFMSLVSLVLYSEALSHTQSHLGCLLCYSFELYLHATFILVIHFELIIVKVIRFVSRFSCSSTTC